MPYLWKTLLTGQMSEHRRHQWQVNKWYRCEGRLVLCQHGFHASPRIINAMAYVSPEVIARVEGRGSSVCDTDKQCWSEMRVVRVWRWGKNDSVALAVFAAERVLSLYEQQFPGDQRPRQAIEVAKQYLQDSPASATEAAGAAASATEVARAARAAAWAAWAAWAAGSAWPTGAASATEAAWAAVGAVMRARAAAAAVEAENILYACEVFIHARLGITPIPGEE